MMVSPETFIENLKGKSYNELLEEREKLLNDIYSFEKKQNKFKEIFISPSPEVRYQVNLQYLGKLCELIAIKYNKEYNK